MSVNQDEANFVKITLEQKIDEACGTHLYLLPSDNSLLGIR